MTFATQLTVLRMALAIAVVGALFLPGWPARAWALAGFAAAVVTDWLDGFLARRWKQTSAAGALLDPIADKILVLGLFAAFAILRVIPAWMVGVILFRELLITGLRLVLAARGIVISAAKEGKHKTIAQMTAIAIILVVLVAKEAAVPDGLPDVIERAAAAVVLAAMWVALALTVLSGAAFLRVNRTSLGGLGRGAAGPPGAHPGGDLTDRLAWLAATGCGLGRLPWAPGSWGSAGGLALAASAAWAVAPPWMLLGLAVALPGCVAACTRAERRAGVTDPGAVVLDEIWAMAVIVAAQPWVLGAWWSLAAAFLTFRVFDVVKPFPLKRMAAWPAGLGIVADDAGAAAYSCLILWLLHHFVA